jgi:hypothetical protein
MHCRVNFELGWERMALWGHDSIRDIEAAIELPTSANSIENSMNPALGLDEGALIEVPHSAMIELQSPLPPLPYKSSILDLEADQPPFEDQQEVELTLFFGPVPRDVERVKGEPVRRELTQQPMNEPLRSVWTIVEVSYALWNQSHADPPFKENAIVAFRSSQGLTHGHTHMDLRSRTAL